MIRTTTTKSLCFLVNVELYDVPTFAAATPAKQKSHVMLAKKRNWLQSGEFYLNYSKEL